MLAAGRGEHQATARLLGAAHAMREHHGNVRYAIYQRDYEDAVHACRNALGENGFESAWAEGAALSVDEAMAYALRGRGARRRPSSGWEVSEGLTNKDIATRLFISPRTAQTHLTHVHTKLGLTSRVQLVQEAARHG